MNIYQRIVLLIGAVCLIWAIVTAPRIITMGGITARLQKDNSFYRAARIEVGAVIARAIGVVGTTMLIWWALSGIGKGRNKRPEAKITSD